MNQVQDIEVLAHIKLVGFIFSKYSIKPSMIEYHQMEVLRMFGYESKQRYLLENIKDPAKEPKKGQLIKAFLDMGFTHTQIGEWFDLTPAAVSWHKMNPPKKTYIHEDLEAFRDWVHTSNKKIEDEIKNSGMGMLE